MRKLITCLFFLFTFLSVTSAQTAFVLNDSVLAVVTDNDYPNTNQWESAFWFSSTHSGLLGSLTADTTYFEIPTEDYFYIETKYNEIYVHNEHEHLIWYWYGECEVEYINIAPQPPVTPIEAVWLEFGCIYTSGGPCTIFTLNMSCMPVEAFTGDSFCPTMYAMYYQVLFHNTGHLTIKTNLQ